ncbi:MAG: molybdopterin-dependent oxidoreductase [Desulfatitalea sp.]|nr:molybdopterin-dependent oxidoreductase [Desulfatitalea sp.]NNK02141.1 molybdopterin-dependent oxidoreductase [Desulfatitalea sp.]
MQVDSKKQLLTSVKASTYEERSYPMPTLYLNNKVISFKQDQTILEMELAIEDHPLDDATPIIVRDYSRCIGCGRCLQACNEIQVNAAIRAPHGSRQDHPQGWYPLVDYEHCTHCGQCLQACPVGALFEKKAYGELIGNEARKIRTTCPYCGVGCQHWLHVKENKVIKVTGVEQAEPNYGRLCVKGRFGYDFIHSAERLTHPLIRDGEHFRKASWDEAPDLVAIKFRKIKEMHGHDALAGISCARSINEDAYNMQKLFRAVIGTNNIDHCARTCHAPTVAGLARSFGSGAMTNSFAEFAQSKLGLGSNFAHSWH